MMLVKLAVKFSIVEHKAGIKTDGCFRTYTGIKFNILRPTVDMIEPEDIARGLAHKPHYSGFSPKFFSIAEHSLLVCEFYGMHNPIDYIGQLQALLHDASEAYTGDMIKPLKNLLPNFVLIENRIQSVVFTKYGIDQKKRKSKIKEFDNHIQDIEADAFYHRDSLSLIGEYLVNKHINYLSPSDAYKAFWEKYNFLIDKLKVVNSICNDTPEIVK